MLSSISEDRQRKQLIVCRSITIVVATFAFFSRKKVAVDRPLQPLDAVARDRRAMRPRRTCKLRDDEQRARPPFHTESKRDQRRNAEKTAATFLRASRRLSRAARRRWTRATAPQHLNFVFCFDDAHEMIMHDHRRRRQFAVARLLLFARALRLRSSGGCLDLDAWIKWRDMTEEDMQPSLT